jgi:hypothetical protein
MKLFDAEALCTALALGKFTIATTYVNAEQDLDVAARLRALLYAGRSDDQ